MATLTEKMEAGRTGRRYMADDLLNDAYTFIGAITVADEPGRIARQCALVSLARLRRLLPFIGGATPNDGEDQ